MEEARHLREKNDKLTKELEQLQTDRCADLEELVYLRWVNACLRYELRNYQAPPGKTVARDLSKTLSPKSEEKAKQLIVEYASSGTDEKRSHPLDSDMDCYSPSQASSRESDETSNYSLHTARSTSSKSKFLSKLKKLVLGKDRHGNRSFSTDRARTSCSDSDRRISFSTYSVEDMIGRDSCHSRSSSITEELSPGNQLSSIEEAQIESHQQKKHAQYHGRPSLDVQRMRRLNLEEYRERKGEHESNIGRYHSYERISSLHESSRAGSQDSSNYAEETDSPEMIKLKKFADVLKTSQGITINRRWSSSGK